MAAPAHSDRGASKAERWMVCPGSVREAVKYPEPPSSEYAIEGTHAHTLAALALTENTPPRDYLGEILKDHEGTFEVDADMADAVEVYYEAVMDCVRSIGKGAVLYVEQGFSLDHIHPDLWGTADAVVYDPETGALYVFDYKHGRGVFVDVERNPQLLYYGLGAVRKLGAKHPVKEVVLVVAQPRCAGRGGPIRRWGTDMLELLDWEADLADAVARTEEPDAPLAAGDHCRWCPAGPYCPEQRRKTDELAVVAFDAVTHGDTALAGFVAGALPEDLADWLRKAATVELFIGQVREEAYRRANQGEDIPGYKLVQKQGRAKWTDVTAAAELLRSWGYDGEPFFNPPALRTPGQVRTALKKDDGTKEGGKREEVPAAVEQYINSDSSGTVLVPESDKREAVAAGPQAAFKEK